MTDTTTRYLLVTVEFPAHVDVDTVETTFDGLELSPFGMIADVVQTLVATAPHVTALTAAQVYPGDVVAEVADHVHYAFDADNGRPIAPGWAGFTQYAATRPALHDGIAEAKALGARIIRLYAERVTGPQDGCDCTRVTS